MILIYSNWALHLPKEINKKGSRKVESANDNTKLCGIYWNEVEVNNEDSDEIHLGMISHT